MGLKMVSTVLPRIYENVVANHLKELRQMVFLVGPRQVGKTTTSVESSHELQKSFYLNWDNRADRLKIIESPDAVAAHLHLEELTELTPVVIFDELHKYGKWRDFLKGFFDCFSKKVKIIVTGSARLDVYRAGGDSLMGRYFSYRLHPLSVGEILHPTPPNEKDLITTPMQIAPEDFKALLDHGGFPEPYLRRSASFHLRWNNFRHKQLFQEDLRDLTRIQEIGQLELLAELLLHQVGQLTSYASLAKKINVSVDTVKRWVESLKSFYYCFAIKPWTKNITRSLLKEPKYYLWDWSLVKDEGARLENFVASHLLKSVDFWTDCGMGEYDLYFLRDKEKREVDFLVTKNSRPWILVEVKASKKGGLSPHLFYFQKQTQAEHAFQVVFDMDYVQKSCFLEKGPLIVPAQTFLSQLV